MSGEIDIIPGWTWLPGQPVTLEALDATGTGMTATVRANSIGKRELNPLDLADLVKSVVGGFRMTVKTIGNQTIAPGLSIGLGAFTLTGIVQSQVVVPVGLILGILMGGRISAPDTFYLTARNPGTTAKSIPPGTLIPVVII